MIAALILALVAALAGLGWQRHRLRVLRQRLAATSAELQRVQQSCSLLAPAGIVQRVVSEGLESVAEHKIVTAVFTDLVGYTALSQQLEAAELTQLLNGYFERVSDAVTAHRGRIGTFLGDGILAFFGALEPNPWQCNDAVHAALAMRAAIADYAGELQRQGLPPIAIGVGIHRGSGLAGLIGTPARREFTVVGPTVNIAARVQALTRAQGVDILLTDSVREQLDPRFLLRAMPALPVKGLSEALVTYAVLGFGTQPNQSPLPLAGEG